MPTLAAAAMLLALFAGPLGCTPRSVSTTTPSADPAPSSSLMSPSDGHSAKAPPTVAKQGEPADDEETSWPEATPTVAQREQPADDGASWAEPGDALARNGGEHQTGEASGTTIYVEFGAEELGGGLDTIHSTPKRPSLPSMMKGVTMSPSR